MARFGPVEIERPTIEDLAEITGEQAPFWGERDLSHLHHPMLVHDFGETALLVRDGEGRIIAYLFGLLTPAGTGYIHLIAVREGHRREGMAGGLYAEFESIVRRMGGVRLKAMTRPENTNSIAFHRAMGFEATDTPDYSGPGETRTVFERELGPSAPGMSN
jgi:ribosomal protein S18 acetylase RimI-like enzyme